MLCDARKLRGARFFSLGSAPTLICEKNSGQKPPQLASPPLKLPKFLTRRKQVRLQCEITFCAIFFLSLFFSLTTAISFISEKNPCDSFPQLAFTTKNLPFFLTRNKQVELQCEITFCAIYFYSHEVQNTPSYKKRPDPKVRTS